MRKYLVRITYEVVEVEVDTANYFTAIEDVKTLHPQATLIDCVLIKDDEE